MAASIGKYAANKMLKSEMKKYKDKKVESDYVRTAINSTTAGLITDNTS
jgi:hypothetical protein